MKFSAFSFIFALLVPFIYAAVLDTSVGKSLEMRGTKTDAGYQDVVAYALPDGRRKIDFYLNGAIEGSVIETDDGAEFFDASGNAIDFASVEGLEKRVSPWSFAIKFAQLLSKFGKKAWDFFYCVGLNTAWNCADEFLGCAVSGTAPWLCPSGLTCVGQAALKCI